MKTFGAFLWFIASVSIVVLQLFFVIPAQAGIHLRNYSEKSMNSDFIPTVYILANRKNGTLYIGVTSNLMQRVAQHREGFYLGFSRDKATKTLVWFEQHETMAHAILREKRIKKWNRQWKINLIEADNKDWLDLALDFGFKRLPSLVIDKR